MFARLASTVLTGALIGCSAAKAPDATSAEAEQKSETAWRDWKEHPAIIEIDDADEIFALSDPHGGYLELAQLLNANGLIAAYPQRPDDAAKARWSGGNAILVVAGDLIDKGPNSLAVIDLLRSLQAQAPTSGGHVVVTLGNHEAEFLADPKNNKATRKEPGDIGINHDLEAHGIDPEALAERHDAAGRGEWLANLPFAVRIKRWFFAHSGNTDGDSIGKLEDRLSRALDEKGWNANEILGEDSILEAQGWYGDPDDDSTVRHHAEELGVKHIVFGHDPGAMKDRGRILSNEDESLVKLNVNMGLDLPESTMGGLLLHVHTKGTDSFEVLDAKGRAQPLPRTR